jgi:hypothetical protein
VDALDYTWNRAVITYDFGRQVDAVRTVGSRLQEVKVGRTLKGTVPYLLFAALIMFLAALVLQRKRFFPSREERLLRAFYRRVERECGVRVERGRVGLFEIAERTGNPRVKEFVDIYAGVVYRDRRLTNGEYKLLRQIVREGFRTG